MKTFLYILILLIAKQVYSQQGWFWQNPYPTGNELRDVYFINENVGFAVGYRGTVIKTTDSGDTWITCWTGTITGFYGVAFSDFDNGIVVGDFGTIIKTTNSGDTWITKTSGTTEQLRNIDVYNAHYSTVVGTNGTILRTTDGGDSWNPQLSGTTHKLNDVSLTDENFGTVVGTGGTILRTSDGGSTWYSQLVGISGELHGVEMLNQNVGTVVGQYGNIWKTTNGGEIWVRYQNLSYNYHFRSVSFFDENNGIAGCVCWTTDGGNNWIEISVIGSSGQLSIDHMNSSTAISVGQQGVIFRAENSGTTWIKKSKNIFESYYTGISDVCFSDLHHGIAVANTRLLKTTDGGNTWDVKDIGGYLAISLLNNEIGLIVGAGGIILKTTDGGNTWINKNSGTTQRLTAVCFIDESIASIVGYRVNYGPSTILRTTDGGDTWFSQQCPIAIDFLDVSFLDVDNGMALTGGRTYIKTTDGGSNWIDYYFDEGVSAQAISFIDNNTGIAVGANGNIIKTSNGGITWTSQNSPTSNKLRDVSFIDRYNGIAVGDMGTILRTTNGGDYWAFQTSGTTNALQAVSFTSETTGITVGSFSTILRTTNGGFVSVPPTSQSGMPDNFLLFQNFPNPFNPGTIIKYQLPEPGLITIKVYDVLGNEIVTLVNEEKSAGEYEVEFLGKGLTSGIYFYRLKSANYVETKKMVLIK